MMMLGIKALFVLACVLAVVGFVQGRRRHARNERRRIRHEAHVERLRADWDAREAKAAEPWNGSERRKTERLER